MKKVLSVIAVLATGVLLFSCGNNKGQQQTEEQASITDPREDQTMQRSKVDTLGILYLVNDYLTKLKDNKIDSAMEMLYEASGDTVLPISAKTKQEVLETLKAFPVLSYNIEQIRMFSEQDTEVHYTIEYFKKENGDPRPNTLQCIIVPRRVGYYWYLTIPEKKEDSNFREYKRKAELEREKAESNQPKAE